MMIYSVILDKNGAFLYGFDSNSEPLNHPLKEGQVLVIDAAFPSGMVKPIMPDVVSKQWVEGDPVAATAKTQNVVWEQIKSKREQVKLGGFHEPVSGKWFHSDDRSRSQHLGLALAAASGGIPAGVMWKTMDGSFIEMTAALAADILTAAMTLDTSAHIVAEQHKAAMLASADPGAHDFSTGWPQTYADMLP